MLLHKVVVAYQVFPHGDGFGSFRIADFILELGVVSKDDEFIMLRQIFDTAAKNTLNKLRKNERFESISFAENIAKLLNLKIEKSWEKIETDLWSYFAEEKYDELRDDFNSWFSVARYFYRKAQAGAIITSTKLPKNIIQYFDEIKEAFAFELDRSSISLCRTLIEIALHDKLKKKGLFKTNKVMQIDMAREDQLSRLIKLAFQYRLLSEPLKELSHEIRKKANNVLHIKDTDEISVRGLALKTISDTVSIIEHLYR
jgi:hypothetical protein